MSESRKRRQNSALRTRPGVGAGEVSSRSSQQNRSRMNNSQNKTNFQRQSSYDQVRKIVQEEGRSARNLIQWNVPVDAEDANTTQRKSRNDRHQDQQQQLPRSPHRGSARRHQRSNSSTSRRAFRDVTPPPGKKHVVAFDEAAPKMSPRSAGNPRKGDLRARYWAFLFENLRRAVDEIYQTCEADESVVECKEVIMMLEQCTKDFKSLIERVELLEAYDNAEEGQKPTSLAWEVRKSSPGKSLQQNVTAKEHITPSPSVVRSLNFAGPLNVPGNSWADKVKGSPPVRAVPPQVVSVGAEAKHIKPQESFLQVSTPTAAEEDDMEGWETVQRGGRMKGRSSFSATNPQTGAANHHQTSGSDRYRSLVKENLHKEMLARSQSGPPDIAYFDAHLSVPSADTIAKDDFRYRTSSRESEKENLPLSVQEQNNMRNISQPKGVEESVQNGNVKNAWGLDVDKSSKKIEHDKMNDQVDRRCCGAAEMINTLDVSTAGSLHLRDLDLRDTSGMDDEFSSDDERDDVEEHLTKQLEKELHTVQKIEEELAEEQEKALEEATQEEQNWLKEIEREKSTEIIVDTEPETDGELGGTQSSCELSQQATDWDSIVKQYEDSKDQIPKSWGDMVEEAESRTPGRVVHMHEKLSSPSRKRSPTESRKRHEEKQQKARELREKLMTDQAERLRMLSGKVEEVRSWKDELLKQRKDTMERKMQRAEEKRQVQLRQKVRKAHEEETKANEIAFINTLEAQNKRHDIITKHQEFEARLHDIQEERQRKHEEKAAKEAAVEERRKALEAERLARLQDMQNRRQQRATEFEQRQLMRERERLEAARAKDREREERIAVLNAQQQAHIEELQKKIQQKQDESARRHKENLESIREKAFEMSVLKHSTEDHNDAPRLVPYDRKKLCTVCNIMIPSEVYLMSHLRGRKHQLALKESSNGKDLSKSEIEAFNLAHISDAPYDKPDPQVATEKERQKALKKRCKKLRQRMAQRGLEYENSLVGKQPPESEHRAKLQKVMRDLNKYLAAPDSGPWAQNRVSAVDRALGEIGRIMEKRSSADQTAFRLSGGLTTLSRILLVIDKSSTKVPHLIPPKSLSHACNVYRLSCKSCYDSCHYMLCTNKIGSLVDLLVHQLNILIPDGFAQLTHGGSPQPLPFDPVASSLMQLIATILNCLAKNNPMVSASEASAERMASSGDAFLNKANDIVSYIVSVGVVDKLAQYFTGVRGSIDDNHQASEFLQHSLALLTAMIKLVSHRNTYIFDTKKVEDASQLLATFRVTEIVGIMSLLYGMLLHTGAPSRGDQPPPKLPQHTITVTTMAIKMLNHLATCDLKMLQTVLGEEGTSLELRHIVAYLAWYCNHWTQEELFHEVILSVGYFTVLNQDNQVMMQSGQPPTVLQQLCLLPFQYFSDPALTNVLFPTLICCCYCSHGNREILEQELSCDLLANFIEEKQLEAQTRPSTTSGKKSKVLDKEAERMSLGGRFPEEEWDRAKDYFKAGSTSPSLCSPVSVGILGQLYHISS